MSDGRWVAAAAAVLLAGAVRAELRFTDVTAAAGFFTVPQAWGITLEDVDGDGDIDVMMANNGVENACYDNQGQLHFRGRALMGGARGTEALVPCDVDEDGRLDLLSCAWGGPVALLHGRADGEWDDVTQDSGLRVLRNGQCGGAAFGDLDADGHADLVLPDGSQGDRLYLHDLGKFTDVTDGSGVDAVQGSESALMADFNDDGLLDIYVPRWNDQSLLYSNTGVGIFDPSGAGQQVFNPAFQVGGCAFDADGDGDLDLLLVRGRFSDPQPNLLLLNDGKGAFSDATPAAWKALPAHYQTACTGDVDHDGDLDVFTAAPEGCALWLNDGHAAFSPYGVDMPWSDVPGCNAALWDLDNDGDLDLLLRCRPTRENPENCEFLYRNDLNDANWLTVRPVGPKGRRFCHGAQVRVYRAGGLADPAQFVARRDVTSACGWGCYLPFEAHFGLPAGTYDVEVRFADQTRATAIGVATGKVTDVGAE